MDKMRLLRLLLLLDHVSRCRVLAAAYSALPRSLERYCLPQVSLVARIESA